MRARAGCGRAARVGLLAVSVGLLACLAPAHLAAQDPTAESTKMPSKYGHVFVPAPMLQGPFVRSHVENSLGIGQVVDIEFGVVTWPNGDTLVALNGDLQLAVLQFEYGHALRDWLEVWGQIGMAARLGTDVGSLLSSGVTLSTRFELGWLAQLRETDRSLLSASFAVRNSGFTFVDLPRWIDDIVNGESAQLVRSTPTLRVGTGLHYAWVLNDLIGFTAKGQASFGEALKESGNQWYFNAGGAVSANFQQRYSVPIGLALTLLADSYPAASGEQTSGWQGFGFRVAYTGRDDVMFALTSQGQRVPMGDDQRVTVGVMTFDMRYFF